MKKHLNRHRTKTKSVVSHVTPAISETVLIAACSLIGYLCTFFYYQGVASFYKMPLELIKLDIISVIQMSVLIIGIFLFLFFVFNIVFELFIDVPNNITMYILRFLLIFVLTYLELSLLYVGQIYAAFKFSSIVTLGLICLHLVAFIFSTRKAKGIHNKFEQFNKSRMSNLIDYSTAKIGIPGLGLITIAVVSLSISYKLGYDNAKNKISYQVLSSRPDLAVALMFDDRIVCVKYDKASKAVFKKFTVISYGAIPSVDFETNSIGPLKVQ